MGKTATSGYLARSDIKLPAEKDYCRNGRATPEISALGEGYQVINAGKTLNVVGTSASSPLFAGLISLLNEYRLQNGKSSLGFLNPLLYEMATSKKSTFRDVTIGNNRIDRSGPLAPLSEGYDCAEGWDAVTGFGTPNFADILEYVKHLPSGEDTSARLQRFVFGFDLCLRKVDLFFLFYISTACIDDCEPGVGASERT